MATPGTVVKSSATAEECKQYLDMIVPSCIKYAQGNGQKIVSFLIAQCCFEGGWGFSKYAVENKNILGIGCWPGHPGKSYASWDECIKDYFASTVLGKSQEIKAAGDLDQYFQAFVDSGYYGEETSTNQQYYAQLKSIINKYNLTQYDNGGGGAAGTSFDTSIALGGGGDPEAIRRFYEELFNWNIKNNVFANGTLVVKGRAAYKVGQRIITESENLEYYVEGVTHSFSCYGTWTTQLSVTRGIEPQNRFTPPWGMAEELSPVAAQALIQQTSGEEIDWTDLDIDLSNLTTNVDSGSLDTGNTQVTPEEGGEEAESGAPRNKSRSRSVRTIMRVLRDISDTPSPPVKATDGIEEQIFVYLTMTMELSNAIACGLLANINLDSGFDSKSIGDGGTSYGICQWHLDRWNRLKQYCNEIQYPYGTLQGQLQYLKHDLETSYKATLDKIKRSPDTSEGAALSATIFCREYLMPTNVEEKIPQRAQLARTVYWEKYGR